MANVRKVPYYTMERSLFRGKVWKQYYGSVGAVPINTPQKVSYERLAPGTVPPPKLPKPTKEQLKAQEAEAKRQKALAELQKKQQPPKPKQPEAPKPKVIEAEDKETLPEFDLQDVPLAMDNIGWPTSAKIARKWFANPKHIYNDQPNSVQPIEETTVTFKWVLKFGSVQSKFDDLIGERLYSEKAVAGAKKKIIEQIKKKFIEQNSVSLSFDTTPFISDLRQFHIDWQMQFQTISTSNTLDGLYMTDLTGTLGNFNIYAAIGIVEVNAEKFFKYDKNAGTKSYCIDATATITHIYAYLKDNYSFNDKNDGNSQYLGHWNRNNMILSYSAAVSDLVDGRKIHTNMGSDPMTETRINWDYIPGRQIDKPVDKRTGMVRKFIEKDVYWPVYNRSYNEWRERHNRGGDFMIYSKPQLYKLKKPIIIKMETICRPSEPM
ncbi:MAG: DUF6402 family protein [Propionivibrio sp.]